MSHFEYRVIPAPSRGEKAKDAKTPTDRYSVALTAELNRMAQDGWEYVRADVLPSEERSGLTGRSTVYHNLLVFRRNAPAPAAAAPLTGTRRPSFARCLPVSAEPRASEQAEPRPAVPGAR